VSENVIELNGKRYDAVTGAYLGKSHAQPVPIAPATAHGNGRVVDGFIRPAHKQIHPKTTAVAAPHAVPSTVQPLPRTPVPKPAAAAAHRHAKGAHARAHKPEHAKTLMRTTVHKPKLLRSPAIKPQAPAEVMAKPASSLMRKPAITQVDPSRLARAQGTVKHQAVERFHTPRTGLASDSHHVAVAVKPAHIPVIAVKPAPPATHHAPHPHTDIFEAAMQRATSHQEQPHKHHVRKHRLTNTFAGIAVFLVLGSFITYLNLPSIELHVASAQAGFHAGMPKFQPTGYALNGHVKHAGGTVSMHFTSGDSSYTITQQASDWNSQTLLDSTLALSGAHQAIQKNGETIYVYGYGATAAWVNGGVRYDMTGNATLSTNDIVAIATSL
jgi:hypothetical protein